MAKKKKHFFNKRSEEKSDQKLAKPEKVENQKTENIEASRKNNPKAIIGIKYVYIAIFFILLAGFFNPILRGPELTNLVIVAVLVLFLGLGGLVLVYKSKSRATEKTRWIFLAAGFGVIVLSIIMMYDIMGRSILNF